MKFLGIRTHDEDNKVHIEIMSTEDLNSLDMLHLLEHLIQKLADIYKIPVQYLTGMLHAGFGGDLLKKPTKEEEQHIKDLLDLIKKELIDHTRRSEDE